MNKLYVETESMNQSSFFIGKLVTDKWNRIILNGFQAA